MLSWIDGFLRFRHWLPEPLLRWIDPGGQVPDPQVSHALALAIATFLAATAARLVLHLTEWLIARLRGQVLRQRTDVLLQRVSGIAGLLAITTPWLALLQIRHFARAAAWPYYLGLVGLLVWLAVRSMDAHVAWVDVRRRAIVLQRGLALGPVQRTTVPEPLLVVRQADGTVPPTPQKDAWMAIRRQFGSRQRAERFLRDALHRLRLPWVALPPDSIDTDIH